MLSRAADRAELARLCEPLRGSGAGGGAPTATWLTKSARFLNRVIEVGGEGKKRPPSRRLRLAFFGAIVLSKRTHYATERVF